MWVRKAADPDMVKTVIELTFMNQHKNLTTNMMIRLIPLSDTYSIVDALAEAQSQELIFCSNGRWGVRAKYLKERSL
jgi:hypothetical protein